MNKKLYFTLLFLCFGLFVGMAQEDGHFGKKNKEKIRALKIAYFTENLDLTEKEAQQFWPIYNAYDDKNHELRVIEMSKIKREAGHLDDISEVEASAVLDRIETLETQIHQNNQDLTKKLKKILPAKKIIRLKKAERDFNRELMKKFRQKRRDE